MPDKKKAPSLKQAAATQKISKDELAALIKKAEQEDPEADQNVDVDDDGDDDDKPRKKK